jgi:hypothetical protein
VSPDGTFISGLARAIGPLVKYYRTTGHGPALELAVLLKDKAVAEFFADDGRYDGELFGHHTHSTTCVMSSLAQLVDLTRDESLLRRVKAFYDNGLWEIRDGLGWVIESSRPDSDPDRGEVNNTGDIVETALMLSGFSEATSFHLSSATCPSSWTRLILTTKTACAKWLTGTLAPSDSRRPTATSLLGRRA